MINKWQLLKMKKQNYFEIWKVKEREKNRMNTTDRMLIESMERKSEQNALQFLT